MSVREQDERRELERVAGRLTPSAVEAITEAVKVAGSDPLREAVLVRALGVLSGSLSGVSARELSEAASAPTHYTALLRLLESAGVADALAVEDPLADARIGGLEDRVRLLEAEGGTVTSDKGAELLGVSRETVNQRRKAGKLLALSTGKRGYRYPVWQFDEDRVLPGLEEALRHLSVVGQWGRIAFFLGENEMLDGQRPLDLLRQGRREDIGRVVEAARARGEQVAD